MKVTVVIRAKIDVKNVDAIQGQPEDGEFSGCNVELSIMTCLKLDFNAESYSKRIRILSN